MSGKQRLNDRSLQILLDLDGSLFVQPNGIWTKIEARNVSPSKGRPHGIKYSLTLHDISGERVPGFDNAHQVKEHRRIEWDHKHANEVIKPYKFTTAAQLLEDFFKEVDRYLNNEQ